MAKCGSAVTRKREAPQPLTVPWTSAQDGCVHVLFASDSKVVAKWCAGEWMPKYNMYSDAVNFVHKSLAAHMLQPASFARDYPTLRPAAAHWNFWLHQYREFNELADALAKQASKGASRLQWYAQVHDARYLWVQVDGSLHPDGCGCSVTMWARQQLPSSVWVNSELTLVASISLQIEAESVVQTELVAALLALCLVRYYIQPNIPFSVEGLHGKQAMAVVRCLLSSFGRVMKTS